MREIAILLVVRTSLVSIALAAVGLVAPGGAHNGGASYQAGYAAASNPTYVRSALSAAGINSTSFCEELFRRSTIDAQQRNISNGDFHRGCERAVHEVME